MHQTLETDGLGHNTVWRRRQPHARTPPPTNRRAETRRCAVFDLQGDKKPPSAIVVHCKIKSARRFPCFTFLLSHHKPNAAVPALHKSTLVPDGPSLLIVPSHSRYLSAKRARSCENARSLRFRRYPLAEDGTVLKNKLWTVPTSSGPLPSLSQGTRHSCGQRNTISLTSGPLFFLPSARSGALSRLLGKTFYSCRRVLVRQRILTACRLVTTSTRMYSPSREPCPP